MHRFVCFLNHYFYSVTSGYLIATFIFYFSISEADGNGAIIQQQLRRLLIRFMTAQRVRLQEQIKEPIIYSTNMHASKQLLHG